jgi:hypothetical protein
MRISLAAFDPLNGWSRLAAAIVANFHAMDRARLMSGCSKKNGRPDLLDHVVGAGEQRWQHGDARRPCGLQVKCELELFGPLRWQVGRHFVRHPLVLAS